MYFLKFCFSQFLGTITFVIKVVNFFSRVFSIYSMLKKFQYVCGKYFPEVFNSMKSLVDTVK